MSSTNKTTNYELSQFIGSDKPAWLQDYNADMTKIDTAIHTAASTATGADGKADANATNIGNLENLTTGTKTSLVSAINEVDGNADTAQNTASQAATIANTAKTEADALSDYLSITQNGSVSVSVSGGTIGNINDMYYALNADGTFGKVYGRLRIIPSTTGTVTVTLTVPNLGATSTFSIAGMMHYTSLHPDYGWTEIGGKDATVHDNGTITFTFSGQTPQNSMTFWFPACLYFFRDFGDVINPNA